MSICTGDVGTGSDVKDYSGEGGSNAATTKTLVHHKGYANIGILLDEAKRRFPNPSRILFVGQSAGGIAVTFNTKQLVQRFPDVPTFVVNDSGLLFRPPYVNTQNMQLALNNWGAIKNSPTTDFGEDKTLDLGDIVRYNLKEFPKVQYAFIDGYSDIVMSAFSLLLNAPSPQTAVKETMNAALAEEFKDASNAHVYYARSAWHVYGDMKIYSKLVDMQVWLNDMTLLLPSWKNIVPVIADPATTFSGNSVTEGDVAAIKTIEPGLTEVEAKAVCMLSPGLCPDFEKSGKDNSFIVE